MRTRSRAHRGRRSTWSRFVLGLRGVGGVGRGASRARGLRKGALVPPRAYLAHAVERCGEAVVRTRCAGACAGRRVRARESPRGGARLRLAGVRRRLHGHTEHRLLTLGQRARLHARLAAHPGAGRFGVRGQPRRDAARAGRRQRGAGARSDAARRHSLVSMRGELLRIARRRRGARPRVAPRRRGTPSSSSSGSVSEMGGRDGRKRPAGAGPGALSLRARMRGSRRC